MQAGGSCSSVFFMTEPFDLRETGKRKRAANKGKVIDSLSFPFGGGMWPREAAYALALL